jgi:hypothetical protein
MDSPDILERAEDFIWRNARLLDRHRFAYLFGRGSREAVIAALGVYQNDDGGFGNALEPDKRCPDSQPVDVEVALRILDEVGFDDPLADAIMRRACDFLSMVMTPEGGVPFVLPSVRGYPRVPWWNTDDDPPASINPTAAIAGILLKNDTCHAWVGQATEFCWRKIATSETTDVHELACIFTFLEHCPDRARTEAEFARIAERMLAAGVVALAPEAPGYVWKPLDFAPTPESICRRLFDDDVIAAHLDALIARQQPDGGWPISWEPPSPMAELEWRGFVTIAAMKTLRAYGRLRT